MAKALAKTRKRYTPLDLAYSRSVSGALNQTYDANYQTYDPDRGLVPLEILFTVRATDPKGVITPGIINSKLTDIRWYENVVDDAHNILDSNTSYIIDRNGTTDSRGKLTARKNTPLDGVVLIFTAKYTDPRNGKVVNVTASITLGVTISTEEPLRVKPGYPFGQVVDPTERRDIIEIDNPLFVGDREYEGAIFRWQKKVGSNYMTIAEGESGITGTFSGKLKVLCPAVGKRMDIRCIADALPDLTGVNLISKAMISDDWNAISAGISTPGEDADGKYFRISGKNLVRIFGGATGKDIFSNKINYKNNQRYSFQIKYKAESTYSSAPVDFVIMNTDKSRLDINIRVNQTTLITRTVNTQDGKTIEKITGTCGEEGYVRVYDIQLVEYNGASNLVTGGAFKRVPASGVSAGNTWGTFPLSKEIADTLVPGTKVTLSIEDVNFVAGSANSLTVNLYTGTNSTNGSSFPLSTKRLTITIREQTDTRAPQLLVCGGVYDNMVGNAVELRGVMLVIGETAYKYSPADGEFIPALADGAPRPENPSERAITTDHVLSTRYPKSDIEVVAPAEILDETSLFGASVVMHSNRGDIVKPELYWSFPWKDKTGAVFARGSKVFIKEEQFDNDEFDYSVEAIEGLNEAKWAPKLNGIDQLLYVAGNFSDNSPTINKRHVIEFILNEDISSTCYLIDYHYTHTTVSDNKRRVVIKVVDGNKFQVLVKNKDEALVYLAGSLTLPKDKLYRCELVFNSSGQLSIFKVNGTIYPTTTGSATLSTETTRLGLGGYASPTAINTSPVTILRYEFWSSETNNYLLYDFLPVNGDRSKMLTNKGTGGVWTLTAVNAPDATTEIDPENGFFVTI